MSFENLLNDLQALQESRAQQDEMMKSLAASDAADDDKVKAAAAEAGATLPQDSGEGAGEGAGEGGAAGAGEGGEVEEEDDEDNAPPMAKSFMYDADGEPVEIVDATEMLKSLAARVEQAESGTSAALSAAVTLLKSQDAALRTQGELIKSLAAKVESIGSQGRGRAAVVSVAEKPATGTLAKSEPTGMNPGEFMAKALEAQRAGRLTGRDVSIAEGYLQKGMPVPAEIINRVLA